ncbi:MAG: hypothetical protein GHCLOJNM_04447 [bacterium]|nr:hypothetical protein [bacterium]
MRGLRQAIHPFRLSIRSALSEWTTLLPVLLTVTIGLISFLFWIASQDSRQWQDVRSFFIFLVLFGLVLAGSCITQIGTSTGPSLLEIWPLSRRTRVLIVLFENLLFSVLWVLPFCLLIAAALDGLSWLFPLIATCLLIGVGLFAVARIAITLVRGILQPSSETMQDLALVWTMLLGFPIMVVMLGDIPTSQHEWVHVIVTWKQRLFLLTGIMILWGAATLVRPFGFPQSIRPHPRRSAPAVDHLSVFHTQPGLRHYLKRLSRYSRRNQSKAHAS